jgi:hypothetical protein
VRVSVYKLVFVFLNVPVCLRVYSVTHCAGLQAQRHSPFVEMIMVIVIVCVCVCVCVGRISTDSSFSRRMRFSMDLLL